MMEACWDTPHSWVVAHVSVADGEGAVPLLPPEPGIEHQHPLYLNGSLRRNRIQTWLSVVQIISEQAARFGCKRAEVEHSQGPVLR